MNTMPKMHTYFNTQPPEGGWMIKYQLIVNINGFNTQPPEGGWMIKYQLIVNINGFNTQPPEGGWITAIDGSAITSCFNTQPPEGGWACNPKTSTSSSRFQHTAARRRLAGTTCTKEKMLSVSTHSRPKAAGLKEIDLEQKIWVSTHSRPKAAGQEAVLIIATQRLFQHTAARRRLDGFSRPSSCTICFNTQPPEGGWLGNDRAGF